MKGVTLAYRRKQAGGAGLTQIATNHLPCVLSFVLVFLRQGFTPQPQWDLMPHVLESQAQATISGTHQSSLHSNTEKSLLIQSFCFSGCSGRCSLQRSGGGES